MTNKPWPSFLDGIGNGLGYAKILVIGDSASPAASLRGSTDIRAGGIAHRKHRSAEGNARKREVPAIENPKEKF